MAQPETEHLTRILTSAALARAVTSIAELGTEAQFRSLLNATGFELKSITPTTSMVSVVEARPVQA